MSKEIPMDHGDTKACLCDHFVGFEHCDKALGKDHLMFKVIKQRTIYF